MNNLDEQRIQNIENAVATLARRLSRLEEIVAGQVKVISIMTSNNGKLIDKIAESSKR